MLMRNIILSVAILFCSWQVNAEKQIVIIGGGPTPEESQVSIQLNTEWIIKIINKRNPSIISHIFYTDGNASGVDVKMKDEESIEYELLKPLALIYGSDRFNGMRYYSSYVSDNVLPATAENISNTLSKIINNIEKDDELLLIFQGHGGYSKNNTSDNYLRLWKDSKLTVKQLEAIFSKAEKGSTIRFVLPQCFSGGFSKLIYKNANPDEGLAEGARCGFLAQNEHFGSEGCTSSVDTDNYRDYSTYLFGAIDGKKINGDVITSNIDIDMDGEVTLYEAHTYTLANAHSIDYSTSTSEDYLEKWQPWYMKWLPKTRIPDNKFNKISAKIASRYNIKIDSENMINDVSKKLADLDTKKKLIIEQKNNLQRNISKLRKDIRKKLEHKWPLLSKPYTSGYSRIITNELTAVNQLILNNTDYNVLLQANTDLIKLEEESLELSRDTIQLLKILRMRHMAILLEQFSKYAGKKEKLEYSSLTSCEKSSIFD